MTVLTCLQWNEKSLENEKGFEIRGKQQVGRKNVFDVWGANINAENW
jgi:hypothetical protein